MSIRPIDFQSMIPKNIKMSQENQNLNNRERLEHQNLVIKDQKNTEQQLNRVNTFEQKAHPSIRHKNHSQNGQGKKQNYQGANKEEKENDETNHNEKVVTGKGVRIDIMI